MEVLGELGSFAGTGLANHDDNLVLMDELEELVAVLEDGE